MRGRIAMGAAVLAFAMGVLLSASALPAGSPGEAEAAGTTIEFGSDWFCDPSFENSDLNSFCETVISVGDTVTWQWVEGRHDIVECGSNWSKWNNQNEICEGAAFDSGTLSSSNTTWSLTFDTPGEYWYVCTRHFPDQKGKIIVQAAAVATPTPAPTETPASTATPAASDSPTPTVLGTVETPAAAPMSDVAELPKGGGAPGGHGSAVANIALALGGLIAVTGALGIFLGFRRRGI